MKDKRSVIMAALLTLSLVGCGRTADRVGDESSREGEAAVAVSESSGGTAGDAAATQVEEQGGYAMEEVWFERDGKRIYGQLYLPSGSGPYPLAILSHGFGGNLSYVTAYAQAFAEGGIAACAFDFVGGGMGSRSDGSMTEMSVLTEAADLGAVLDGLIARDDIDASNVFLLGGSQGGFVSTYVAAARPSDVKALVALYPAYVLQDDAWSRTPDPDAIPETMSLMGMTIGRIYNEDAMSFDIYDMMAGYPGDVLIIHGTSDTIVPISYSERAVETFPSAELVRFEGAGHGFYGADEQRSAELAIDFVLGHLEDAVGKDVVTVTVNGVPFSATLDDGEAASALAGRLPLTLDMAELNGNEKYAYLGESLPADPYSPGRIEAGDLMLFGDDCVVLFYEGFDTGYSYTRLGHIDDPTGLAEAAGTGRATMTITR